MDLRNRCWAEISAGAILHNIHEVKKRLEPGVKLLAVVKANAYGHGAVFVSRLLDDEADWLGVAAPAEAAELREAGIEKPILILGHSYRTEWEEMIRLGVAMSVSSWQEAWEINRCAEEMNRGRGEQAEKRGSGEQARCTEAGKRGSGERDGCGEQAPFKARIHIALDTGMTRIGFDISGQSAAEIAEIASMPYIDLEGMFSHLSCADQQDQTFSEGQIGRFKEMIALLSERGVEIPIIHLCNSAGIMEFTDYRYDMVRSGIVTYGLYPSEDVTKSALDLIPALSWKCRVSQLRITALGRGVSYGATYYTEKPVTTIAVLSVGYADGYPRALSSKGRVLIRGQYAPIIGRVCMDQMMVDVTDIDGVSEGDVATLIGCDGGNRISAEEVADPAGRFNYEMVCTITSRVPRIPVD